MEKLIFTIATAALMFSCSENGEPNKSDVFEKSKKYLEGKINTNPDKYYAEFNSLDTIRSVSSRKIEMLRMNRLNKEFEIEYGTYLKLEEIHKQFGSERSEATKRQESKALVLSDSISRWEARANNLSKIDTIAYIAKISGVGNDVATGAKMKGIEMAVIFDLEFDVDLVLNNLLYGE